jgi:hypothetical protein
MCYPQRTFEGLPKNIGNVLFQGVWEAPYAQIMSCLSVLFFAWKCGINFVLYFFFLSKALGVLGVCFSLAAAT